MSFRNSMQAVQRTILNYTKNGRPYEILAAILAARQFNTIIKETDLESEAGKKRQLKINYYPPVCEDNGTCNANICDTGTVLEPKQMFFEIGQCTASAVYQLNKDDIRFVDGNYLFSDHAKAQIASVLPTVRKKMATQMAALLVANAGVIPITGNTTKLLPWMDNSTGTVNPTGLWEVERVYRDGGFDDPFIIGGTSVFNWRKAVDIGGLNQNGLNVAQMGRTNAYYDSIINETYADPTHEHVIAFDPQMLKFVSFNRNAGIFATDLDRIEDIDAIYQRGGTDYIEGVMADPLTGLLWDLNVNYDKCNKRWTFQWQLEWDIFFMPPMVCNIQGVNGVTHFLTCAPVETECPVGSLPEPADEATFTYTPGSQGVTFPLYIGKLELAGQTSYPNATVANIAALNTLFNANVNGITFVVDGATIEYEGYAAIAGQLNDTTNITFS